VILQHVVQFQRKQSEQFNDRSTVITVTKKTGHDDRTRSVL